MFDKLSFGFYWMVKCWAEREGSGIKYCIFRSQWKCFYFLLFRFCCLIKNAGSLVNCFCQWSRSFHWNLWSEFRSFIASNSSLECYRCSKMEGYHFEGPWSFENWVWCKKEPKISSKTFKLAYVTGNSHLSSLLWSHKDNLYEKLLRFMLLIIFCITFTCLFCKLGLELLSKKGWGWIIIFWGSCSLNEFFSSN